MIAALHTVLAKKREKGNDEGFTLIELLVVVLIIGILAAIAVPVYLGIQDTARESAIKADLANVKTSIVAYITQNNTVPAIADLDVTIDASNYSSVPAWTTTPAGPADPWVVGATATNGDTFEVTDSTAPTNTTP